MCLLTASCLALPSNLWSLFFFEAQAHIVSPRSVISGHLGWVRTVAVDPSNQWFATGSADRTIKIWDLASGTLKLTLTGHIATVRGLVVSDRHPYIFSVSDDKEVKCWDMEVNKVVRQYHGHLRYHSPL